MVKSKSKTGSRKEFVDTMMSVYWKNIARNAGSTLRSKETRRLRMGKIKGKVFEMMGDKDKGEYAHIDFIHCI